MLTDIIGKLGEVGIIPVVKIEEIEQASRLARTLVEAGLPCAEITFRTHHASDSIKRIAAEYPQLLVGAGTILSVEQARQALAAGAKFIVSPGLDLKIVDYCLERDVAVIPGIATPGEAMQAMGRGLKVLKFFPAEAMGGIRYLQAISPALPGAAYIPTGGISAESMVTWLKLPVVHAVAGSWLVTPGLLQEGNYAEVSRLASQAIENVKTARQPVEAL